MLTNLTQKLLEALPKKKDLPITIRCATGEKIGQWESGFAEGSNSALSQSRQAIERVMGGAEIDEGKIREYLWLSHGHQGLYGDDGEMQCGQCLLDFKRDSFDRIVSQLIQLKERGIRWDV